MATITFQGTAIQTSGELPAIGTTAPDFLLTDGSLNDIALEAFAGKKKVLNIVPSLDTGVCATSARRFNQEATAVDNTVIITISADLPFAQKRFCDSEKLSNITTLSTMRGGSFGADYGVIITNGPLKGLMTRAVIVLDTLNKVIYTELVPEITEEPNYEGALAALKS
ncbi:MAG: thiol peroxidase [Candidatus Ancaeobacter aquaticus]|nr:thiol peroxidase [Candidatus Ancaeobacter aquaticus]